MQRTSVAIVGLGGTGSVLTQQLAHLGVHDFLLVDRDQVESTNLNRLVGASSADVGREKVAVAKGMVGSINPDARVRAIARDIMENTVARDLAAVDAIFSCTDTHASRVMVNQVAYQYLVPAFDVGVGIFANKGSVTHIVGRVQMVSAGLGCLICSGVIDSNAVRIELLTPEERARDRYITGDHIAQPAVISLNSTVASLCVTMFIGAFTGLPATERMQFYNALTGVVRPATVRPDASCIVCSAAGAQARGDEWPLPGRQA